MKGFVLDGMMGFLARQYDKNLVSELIISMGHPAGGVYLSMADYPDNTLDLLTENAANLLEIPKQKLAKILGVYLFSELLALNPKWIEQSQNSFEWLKHHDLALHAITEVGFPGFVPPSFDCTAITENILEVNYRSTFLPALMAEGLIDAGSHHYKEHFSIEKVSENPQVGFNQKFILRRKQVQPIF